MRLPGTLAAIAQQLQAQADSYGWLRVLDGVGRGAAPLTDAEIAEWRSYLTDAGARGG